MLALAGPKGAVQHEHSLVSALCPNCLTAEHELKLSLVFISALLTVLSGSQVGVTRGVERRTSSCDHRWRKKEKERKLKRQASDV